MKKMNLWKIPTVLTAILAVILAIAIPVTTFYETMINAALGAETQKIIDEKVVELVRKQHEKAAQILLENREKLDELSLYLYQKETITGDEFMNILNV